MRPADEPLYTSEYSTSPEPDARWLGRRARNVARRPLVLALFTAGAFLVALLTVILVPGGREPPPPPPPLPRQDTTRLIETARSAGARLASAESSLAAARADLESPRMEAVVIDTFPPALRARRATLGSRIREVSAVVRRASDAPLPASYRAVADLPELSGDSSVAALLDSLGEVERARAQVETEGEADTAFMALTARMTRIGDSIVQLAERRVRAMQRELVSLAPARVEVARPDTIDTLPLRFAADSSRQALAATERRLVLARRHNDSIAVLETRAPSPVEPSASPGILIAAAAVSGLAIGFLVALAGEVRRPAVADAREAEVAAGIPVLAHITDVAPRARQARRRADRDVPPLIELTSDSYDRLYYRLADSVARLPQLAVLGDDPDVVAIVSANLAAAAARNARATLLLDADFDSAAASSVLGIRREPGMADVLANRVHWSSAIAHCMVGRDRVIDVLPAGGARGGGSWANAATSFGAEVARIAGRYDTVIVGAPVSRRGAVSAVSAAVPEGIVCVRISRTPVRLLQRIVAEARADGARLRGVVLWSRALDPVLANRSRALSAKSA